MRGKAERSAQGVVVSDKMDKTVVVDGRALGAAPEVQEVSEAPEQVQGARRAEPLRIGDEVEVIETRPLSRDKRWRVRTDPGEGGLSGGASTRGVG